MTMMIDVDYGLLDIHERDRPLSDIRKNSFHMRRDQVLGPDKWDVVKPITK